MAVTSLQIEKRAPLALNVREGYFQVEEARSSTRQGDCEKSDSVDGVNQPWKFFLF